MAEATIETENCRIYYDEVCRAVILEWHGYSTSVQFKKIIETMLKTLEKHQASKVLADIRDMTIIGLKDQEWIIQNFLPRAFEKELKSSAIVKPVSVINQAAVSNILKKVDKNKFSMRSFDNRAEAEKWLGTL